MQINSTDGYQYSQIKFNNIDNITSLTFIHLNKIVYNASLGMSIGIGLFIALTILIIYLLCSTHRRRRRHKNEKANLQLLKEQFGAYHENEKELIKFRKYQRRLIRNQVGKMYNIHTKTPLKTKDYKSLPYAMPIIRVHSQFCKGPLQIVQTIKPKNHKYQSILLSLGKPHYVYNPVIRSYYNFVRWRQFLEEFNKYQILMDSHEYFLSRLKERNQQLIFGKEDSKKRKSLRWLYKPKREPTKPGIKHDPSFLKILRHSRSKHNSLPSECLT